jgi:Cu/Zn superoxide dismutase
MGYVAKKQRKCTSWYSWSTNTNTGIEMMRKKQGERWGKVSMNSDGQQEEKKTVHLRTNDEKHWTGIHVWSNTHADTNNREKKIGYCDRETTMVSNGRHTLSVIEKWGY